MAESDILVGLPGVLLEAEQSEQGSTVTGQGVGQTLEQMTVRETRGLEGRHHQMGRLASIVKLQEVVREWREYDSVDLDHPHTEVTSQELVAVAPGMGLAVALGEASSMMPGGSSTAAQVRVAA